MNSTSPAKSPLASLTQHADALRARPAKTTHLLVILPAGDAWHDAPDHVAVESALKRQDKKAGALAKSSLMLELPGGCLSSWLRLDEKASAFDWQTKLRKALKPLLDEHPAQIDIAAYGDPGFIERAMRSAASVGLLNGQPLTHWKTEKATAPLKRIVIHGVAGLDLNREIAVAEGSQLTRELTWLPPNLLTPGSYRKRIRALAKDSGWSIEEYDLGKLEKLGAGAFLAVARGSRKVTRPSSTSPTTVCPSVPRARHSPPVGKGICFDTGGHNLKPARYMNNMHDDMNGSAVVLGILHAATRLKLPLRIDAWLAIAQNHLSPEAYTQNEVVKALNGTSIEIVHTDAEGRMVLADTLTLAARAKPETIIDFATLTGSMAVAVGERMSGIVSNRDALAAQAVAAGQTVGERVVAFPMPEDYDEELDSPVADVKQCTLESEADHILAARFLQRFVADTPWLHVDLSASRCKGGLGAVGTDITGFGVGLGVALLIRN
ncbi:MAG: leucyl aminopeptidase family protein [Hydrogenophilales bacterium]|nr:leucyl aminopeptidase family protein [Hydrogenophilales bacterium]